MEILKKQLKNWLYVDTRVLAIFRIMLGFLGMWDVLRRYYVIDVFYSVKGMNFRREVVSSLSIKYFTLLDTFRTTTEVQLFFITTIICFFMVMIGYRTKLFQILAVMGLVSIHNAAVILENGGDMVVNNYLIWSLFLPLGSSWSVDALRKSLRNYQEADSTDLNKPLAQGSTKIFHIAYFACLVQLSIIYIFNFLNKTGAMWNEGTAVFYMYQLDTFLTPLGYGLNQIVGFTISKFLTYSTLIIECVSPILILSPVFQPWLRRIIWPVLLTFHIIIGLSIEIGLFSWIMIAAVILLLADKDIRLFKNLLAKICRGKYTIFYDRDCGFCHLIARIIKRMDVFGRITWSDKLTIEDKPQNLNTLLETTIVVWNKETNEIFTRHNGFAKIIAVLPFGFLFSWILLIPGIEKLFGFGYDQISQNRTYISTALGLQACGIPQGQTAANQISAFSEMPVQKWCQKGFRIVLNLIVFLLLVGVIDYSLRINEGLEDRKADKSKTILKAAQQQNGVKELRTSIKRVLLYPRMYQQWNMFSPTVIRNEKWVLADVTFQNGESITLFEEDSRLEEQFHRKYFYRHKDQFWRKLFSRLKKTTYQKHIPTFNKWLKTTDYFPEFEGRRVKNVKLWMLNERSPDPETPRGNRPKVIKTELVQTDLSDIKRRETRGRKTRVKRSTRTK